jgi:hypothetical protein
VFGAMQDSAKTKLSQLALETGLAERVAKVSQGRAWLKLTFAQDHDPAFRALHEELLDEIERRTDFPLHHQLGWSSMTIMLASPRDRHALSYRS